MNQLPWQALALYPRLACSTPKLLCRVVSRSGQEGVSTTATATAVATVLLAHCQPQLLLEIVDDTLQHTWSFPCDIVSFCWNDASDPTQVNSEQPRALVATEDGRIWSIPLLQSGSVAVVRTGTLSRSSSKVTIEIDDSEDEAEEIELWNDEDGLLDSAKKLDTLAPAAKRQRTSFTRPSMLSPSLPNNRNGHRVQVNTGQHYVGLEEGVAALVWALDGLLILRRGKDSVLWISRQGFHPGDAVEKRVVAAEPPLHNALVSSHSPRKAFVGAGSGAIYRIRDVDHVTAAQKIHSLQEPVASLILIPHPHLAQAESLLALGTLGGICWIDLQVSDDSLPVAVSTKRSIEERIQSAYLTQGYIYVLKVDGCVLRVRTSSIASDRTCDWERLDLPKLRAFVPIIRETDAWGFYGINSEGRILRFLADLTSSARPQLTSDARDSVTNALVELERLSDQARRLGAESQIENQRIATFNRLVQELQQCTLSRADHGRLGDSYTPPVNVTFTAFVQPIAEGYNGHRRYCIRLSLQSALNIPWEKGWSAVVTMRTNKSCPHRVDSKPGRHIEVFASLADLTPQTTWTRDFDVDLQSLDLPLTITLGLQLDEEGKQTHNPVSAYFNVESFDLDAIHFAEPVQDRPKNLASFHTHAPARPLGMSGEIGRSQDSISRLFRPSNEQDTECEVCALEFTELILKPIAFDVDTQEIQMAQCLPALLGDGLPNDRIMALVQSSFRGSLYIPEECLPRRTGAAGSVLSLQQTTPTLAQLDIGKVWVTMETKDTNTGANSIMQATVSVKGSDPRRTSIIYRALQRRVAELFE